MIVGRKPDLGVTGMSTHSDSIKVYMHDIGGLPLIDQEEEFDLAAAIAAGSEDARAKLILSNVRLVVKIAHDFKGLGLPILDLVSEGNIGLMRAVEKFDPNKGAKFSSYAAWWIKQAMRRALANQSRTVRVPVQSAGKINKIRQAREALREKLQREPADSEIAEVLHLTERTVSSLRRADLHGFSLNDPIQAGENGQFEDIIPDKTTLSPDKLFLRRENIAQILSILDTLDEREQAVLKMRFGLDGNKPRTLEEVSKKVGRTRERVRQIQNSALAKLKDILNRELDDETKPQVKKTGKGVKK